MKTVEDIKKELAISHDHLDICNLLEISVEDLLDRFEDKLLENWDAACAATGMTYETKDQVSEEEY